MSDSIDVEAIKAREAAATPGDWGWECDSADALTLGQEGAAQEFHVLTSWRCRSCTNRNGRCVWPSDADAEFIAHARADVPALVAEVEGCARGADRIASAWADDHAVDGVLHVHFPADWSLYGKRAGVLRNADMLRYLLAQREAHGAEIGVLAFHDDLARAKGTGDMVRRAEAAGVAVGRFSHAPQRATT